MVQGLTRDILRALRRCRRETDFYRLRMAVENLLSPREAAELISLRGRMPRRARAWIDEYESRLFSVVAEPQPYERLRLGTNVWYYGHGPGEARRPHLAIGFCGSANRLMMATAAVLQHLDASQFDVVVLTDPTNRAYMTGIHGYADDFDGILRRLDEDVNLAAYRSVRCLGTSIGGVVALRAGIALHAERALSMCGRPIRTYGAANDVPPAALAAFEDTFRRAAEAPTRLICAYGADHAEDREGALELARELGGEALGLPGISNHGLPHTLLKQGRLRAFFEETLLAEPAAPSEGAAASRLHG